MMTTQATNIKNTIQSMSMNFVVIIVDEQGFELPLIIIKLYEGGKIIGTMQWAFVPKH